MTDSNVFFLNAHVAMQRAGVDTDEVYRRIGIDPDELLRSGTRIPHQGQASFWAAVEAVSGDTEIGLHLCPFLSPFAGEVMNHLFVSSPTMGVGFQRFNKYLRLISDHLEVRMATDLPGPQAVYTCMIGDADTPRHTEITLLYGMLQAVRLATGGRFQPDRLELHCLPGNSPEEFQLTFGCPVSFGAPETRCYFDRSMLDLPLVHADPEAAVAHEAVAHRQMRRVLRQDIIDSVRTSLASQLENESCTVKAIAEQLDRSPRRLRSELLEAGTSFNQILDEVRQSVAKKLLARSEETIEHIAQLAGFSDTSAFFRAFKKWTGITPTQYRNGKRNSSA